MTIRKRRRVKSKTRKARASRVSKKEKRFGVEQGQPNDTSNQSACQLAVPYYLELGWSLIPINLDKSSPIKWKRYQKEQASQEIAEGWFNRWPSANLAVICGRVSGIVVLDVDSKEGQEYLDEMGCPETPRVETARGRHYYFKHPGKRLRKFNKNGLELQVDRHLATLPPSVHKSGKRYLWEVKPGDVEIADMPDWMLEMAKPRPKKKVEVPEVKPEGPDAYSKAAFDGCIEDMYTAHEGSRNDTLNEKAYKLFGLAKAGRLDYSVVKQELEHAASGIGMDGEEVNATLESAWNSAISDYSSLPDENDKEVVAMASSPKKATPTVAVLGSLADAEKFLGTVTWSWDNWLPEGMLSLLSADQEMGKSFVLLALADTFIRGKPWPDGTPYTGEQGSVLWIDTENTLKMTIERARNWGVPIEALKTPYEDPLRNIDLGSKEDQDAIANAANDPGIAALIIDSLGGANSNVSEKDEKMSGLTKPLTEIAQVSGKPILLSHLLRKRGIWDNVNEGVSLERVRGSTAITQLARTVLAIDIPDAELGTRRLSQIKMSLAIKSDPLGFNITDKGLEWVAAPKKFVEVSRLSHAKTVILDLLRNGSILAKEAEEIADANGVSESTRNKAKSDLGVLSKKRGGVWWWIPPGIVRLGDS